MAEDGHHAPSPVSEPVPVPGQTNGGGKPGGINTNLPHFDEASLTSPRVNTPNPFSRKNTSLDLDDYFSGPRDMQKHSKWPIFLQLHGSILPKMILPLLWMGAWASAIWAIHEFHGHVDIDSILLTVLGFVVGLGLSFRSSTAYERYNEGRRYWAQLVLTSQNLGRVYWVHSKEREGEEGKKDLLAKLTALNLLVAFATSLKHKLRYEPYTCYDDIQSLVGHLDTFAQRATREEPDDSLKQLKKPNFFKAVGEYLGVSFAASNPRKMIKKASRPLGNLPLEILSYLASYTDELVANGQLPVPMQQTLAYNNLAALNDVLSGTDRVCNTPLPIAYSIAIGQITWVYIMVLPFQLLSRLDPTFIMIPATVVASYIILAFLFIGREIENPFGTDVNDLPLEAFCAQIAADLDVIASRRKPKTSEWVESVENRVMWPMSNSGWHVWMHRGEDKIREAVASKIETHLEKKKELDHLAEHAGILGKVHSHREKVTVKSAEEAV
ncbi:Bestrophin, RFP-TM, chloride channel-domain-containing protein [Rhypophila decipiens]|uniref:Bestrophin, RFP-TM, chloride channel-domain-containing protein n=1 Tax=Rhypophila decipiens TaxID=261697 RepID=A0AAN7B557_9PEZI|nr:Bestrophin, RFP-TM, chloride channel-domain-containing protein [Rhypophila decipiens]